MRIDLDGKGTKRMYTPIESEMFHVHTYRCGHAENVPDEAFVKRQNSSKRHKHHFWPKFWEMLEYDDALRGCKTLNGLDAHYLGELQIL